jgi:hypothetical protein
MDAQQKHDQELQNQPLKLVPASELDKLLDEANAATKAASASSSSKEPPSSGGDWLADEAKRLGVSTDRLAQAAEDLGFLWVRESSSPSQSGKPERG